MKHNASTNNRHCFNFEGGADLTTMGASWFISYLYHTKIDADHTNWQIPKTADNRKSVFLRTQSKTLSNGVSMHRHYVEQVCVMSPDLGSKNRINIPGERVIAMAKELLKRMSAHP